MTAPSVRVTYDLSPRHREQLFAFYFDQWWASSRSRDEVDRAFSGSLLTVLADDADDMVGFGRGVTDGAIYGWIGDVMVRPDLRGRGLGHVLLDAILAHPGFAGVAKIELNCLPDMDEFYGHWGFRPSPSGSHVLRRAHRELTAATADA